MKILILLKDQKPYTTISVYLNNNAFKEIELLKFQTWERTLLLFFELKNAPFNIKCNFSSPHFSSPDIEEKQKKYD